MTTKELDYEALVKALMKELQGTRTKAVTPPPTGVNPHGPGGLFSAMGLAKPVFTAMMLPMRGLAARLPVRFSNETNPLYGLITGVTESVGSDPVNVCDDPKTAGTMKFCTHSFPFGFLSRQSKVGDIKSAGQTINRGEFTDLQIFGGLELDNPMVPALPGGASIAGAARRAVAKALYELGVAWMRDFARLIYTANPTNNTAGGGQKYFEGLDRLINTGYRDAETGVLCPAADSIVESYGNANIRTNPALFVRRVQDIYRRLKYIASHAGLDPVRWVITMPNSMFYEATEIWPIAYSTTGIAALATGATVFIQDEAKLRARDEMRGDMSNYTGQYLLIDGERVPVIIDDTITETQNEGGDFTADMYFVPMTVLGNEPVTFWEHFNYDAPGAAMEMAQVMAPTGFYYTSDGGRFLWERKAPTNGCVQVNVWSAPRVMLLTPYLAARLTDITYSPLAHERAWDPADPSFWKDGGRTAGDSTDPSYYSPTA
jgi:hypothetical protein